MLRLKEERIKHKMTQEQVAQFLGLSRGAYANIENEKRQCDIEVYIRLADLYNISIDYLLGRSNIRTYLGDKKKQLIATKLDTMSDEQYALVLAYITGIVDGSKNQENQ